MIRFEVDPPQAWRLLHVPGVDVLNVPAPIPDDAWPVCSECDGFGNSPCNTGACSDCGGSGRGSVEVEIYATEEWPCDDELHELPNGLKLVMQEGNSHFPSIVRNTLNFADEFAIVPLGRVVAVAVIESQHDSLSKDPYQCCSEWGERPADLQRGSLWHLRVSSVRPTEAT